MIKLRVCIGTAFLAVLGSMIGPATAGSCGYDYCWGAVGVGPNGAYGFSHSWATEQDAINAAQEGCGWSCDNMRTFYNACAAIAVASNGGWGWAYDVNRSRAEQTALSYCRDFGPSCVVRVWSCSR